MKGRFFILSLAAAFTLVSCNNGSMREPNVSAEVVIEGLSDSLWTYFSIEKGTTVGSSRLGDSAQDTLWAGRLDWDIAICGEYIKTNSGDSGKGLGGLQRNTTDSFITLETAPEEGYLTDKKKRVR